MARPEVEPKTPLAARLRAFRKQVGDLERDEVAGKIGVSKSALASYERGDTEPNASALAAYQREYGASVNWLLTGDGDVFDDPSKAPAPSTVVDPWAMGRAYSAAERVCKEIGRPVTSIQLAEEAATLYSQLLGRIADVRDQPMVEAALEVLANEAKERMISTKPGHGKSSASSW